MKAKIQTACVILILMVLSFCPAEINKWGNNLYAQAKKTSQGALVEKNEKLSIESRFEYTIDLFPGQSFSGWWYFWSNSGTISANFSVDTSCHWLSVSPSSFTSTGCDDIKAVNFIFSPITDTGYYNTVVTDLNGNWESTYITLHVTNYPTINSYDSTVIADTGDAAIRRQISGYFPIEMGCNSSYIPGPNQIIIHTLHPNVSWLTISPNDFTVNLNSSDTAVKTFMNNTPGTYFTTECRTRQYASFPLYTRWTFHSGRNTAAIVRNFPNQEIDMLNSYLDSMGVFCSVFDKENLTFENVSQYNLLIWDDLGYQSGGLNDNLVDIFKRFYDSKKPLYFIGDDLAYSSINLSPEMAEIWRDLLHITGNDNFSSSNQLIISMPSHPVMNGPYGSIGGFGYWEDMDNAQRTNTGEELLGISSNSHVIVSNEGNWSKTITQNCMAYNAGDESSIEERRKLFMNAVSWLMIPPIPPVVVKVGSLETYTSLTDSSGLFNAINSGLLSNKITALITSDLNEHGYFALNQSGSKDYMRIRILPDSAVLRTISGNCSSGLLRLNGADRVTIDGSYNGSGSYLTFRNLSNAPTVIFYNDASEDTIRNCSILGALTSLNPVTNGIITFAEGINGNNNNVIQDCIIRESIDSIKPYNGIYFGTGPTKNTLISGCSIYNIDYHSIFSSSILDSGITIRNSIFKNFREGISLSGFTSAVIDSNIIYHDSASNHNGVIGIHIQNGNSSVCNIKNNMIYNLRGPLNSNVQGIYYYANAPLRLNIVNNIIALGKYVRGTAGYGWSLEGIKIVPYPHNSSSYIINNTISIQPSSVPSSNDGGSVCFNGGNTTDTIVFINNICTNMRTYEYSSSRFVYYITSSNPDLLIMDNNVLYAYPDLWAGFGKFNSGWAHNFSDWKTISGKDYTSFNGNPNYTSDTLLFPDTTSSSCWMMNSKGIPFSLIPADIRGLPRSTNVQNGPTDIGAYEFNMAVGPPTATASGPPAPGERIFYTQSGRNILNILWGAGGIDKKDKENSNENRKQIQNNNKLPKSGGFSWMRPEEVSALPTTVNVQKYSGALLHEADTTGWTNPAKRGTGYWKVSVDQQPTSPFAVTLYFGDEELGNITDPANNLILAKYDPNNHTWTPFPRTTDAGANWSSYVDWPNRTVTVKGLTDFGGTSLYSEFALTDQTAPLSKMRLDLKAIIQGFYNGTTMVSDVMTVELRASVAPYTIIDQSLLTVDTSGQTVLYSYNAIPENFTGTAVNYWIVLRHRNSIETWSASTQPFNNASGLLTYDFTTAAAQAYGDNQILVGGKYCIYNGDVNQDGIVDLFDLIDLDNDNSNFVTGVTPTDLNGDQMVDLFDLIIGDNNNANFVSAVKPPGAPVIKKVRTPEQQRKADEYRIRIEKIKKEKQDSMNKQNNGSIN